MFLQPKKIKYKKTRKGKLSKLEFKSNNLQFGEIGLKAQESGLISARQIESVRRVITRKIKKKGKIWIRIFPYLPITSKPTESRMGKGKGKFSHFICKINSGSIIFELCGPNKKTIIKSLLACKFKLPIKTKLCFKIIT